jgi:hypothetical protein
MKKQNIIEKLKELHCTSPRQRANIRAYLDETLSSEDIEAFEEHLDDCEKCSKIIFLEDYLKDDEIELLTRSDWKSGSRSNERAAAA